MIGNVVALGLSAAINPILVGVVLVTLASPRPKALLGAYVAGGMTVSIAIGIAVVSLASGTGAVTPTTSTTNGLVDLVLGLAPPGRRGVGRDRPGRAPPRAQGGGRRRAPEEAVASATACSGDRAPRWPSLAGVLLTLPSALYLAALKDIAEAGVSTGEELLAIVLFNVLMLSPALIPSGPARRRARRDEGGGRASRSLDARPPEAARHGRRRCGRGLPDREGHHRVGGVSALYAAHAGQKAARSAQARSHLSTNPRAPHSRRSGLHAR